jgi:transcription elongation factor Elf1
LNQVKQQLHESVIPTVREIAMKTKVEPSRFYKCPFCSEKMDNKLLILNYSTNAVELECESCDSHFYIDTDEGIVDGSEVVIFE